MDHIKELIDRYILLTPIRFQIQNVYEIIEKSIEQGGKLLVGGNGGSAADSEHIVGELMKGFIKKRPVSDEFSSRLRSVDSVRGRKLESCLQGAIPAIAITGEVGLSTAFANDVDPMMTYAQQVYGYGRENDVFLAISTSGNAENLMYAATTAHAIGMKVVALTGKDGGKLARIADASIIVRESETYKIQELHLPIYHAICLQLEEHFFEK